MSDHRRLGASPAYECGIVLQHAFRHMARELLDCFVGGLPALGKVRNECVAIVMLLHVTRRGFEGHHRREGSLGRGLPKGSTYHSGSVAPNLSRYHFAWSTSAALISELRGIVLPSPASVCCRQPFRRSTRLGSLPDVGRANPLMQITPCLVAGRGAGWPHDHSVGQQYYGGESQESSLIRSSAKENSANANFAPHFRSEEAPAAGVEPGHGEGEIGD
jgi:hypothetical protein